MIGGSGPNWALAKVIISPSKSLRDSQSREKMFQFSPTLERDASKLETNRRFLLLGGSFYDGTRLSVAMSVFRIFFLSTGIVQYVIKICFREKGASFVTVVEAIHWTIVFSSVVSMVISCLCQSSLFRKMEATVRSGFYNYGGNLSEDQIQTRAIANQEIQFSTKVFSIVCAAALISSYLKAPFFMKKFSLPYPVWFPFTIDNWPRFVSRKIFGYLVAMGWTWFIAEAMVFCAFTNWVAYVAMAGHLIAQFKILILALQEIDTFEEDKIDQVEQGQKAKQRIKECVQHHLVLIKFFSELQRYFDVSLLVTAFSTGLILCTIGFLIISPGASFGIIGSLVLVLIPELLVASFYCVLGQRIADVAEDFGMAIYNLKWYKQPLSVQRELLIMLIGTKKNMQLTGIGLHEFSIKGLSEILQASFSYFNMLVAVNGGN